MTAALAPVAPPHLPRQLATATVLVVAAHALLLLGLPRLRQATMNSIDTGTFITRRIAPPAPAAPAQPAPAAEPESAPPPKPEPEPVAKPVRPRPAPPAHKPAAQPTTAPPAPPQAAAPAGATEPSLLTERPTGLGNFGGGMLPQPIVPPLPADATGPALALAQTLGDAPVRIPRAAELGFQASGSIGGQAFAVPVTLQWRQDGQWYESRFGFYNPKVGTRTREVAGLITPQGLLPVRLKARLPEEQDIRFDYDQGQVAFSASGAEAPLAAGMQDRLSVMFQLGALLAGDPERYPVGTAISLPAAFERGEGSWRFAVEADEDVPALGKPVPAVHLVHVPFDERGARLELWLGRTLDYLPVRLRTTEPNGDTIDYTLLTAWAQPTPTAPAAPKP